MNAKDAHRIAEEKKNDNDRKTANDITTRILNSIELSCKDGVFELRWFEEHINNDIVDRVSNNLIAQGYGVILEMCGLSTCRFFVSW